MSAGTKHGREEGEDDETARLPKKSKTDAADSVEGLKSKKSKKDKKDKKERKEKKDKKKKKEKKHIKEGEPDPSTEASLEETPLATVSNGTEAEADAKEDGKSKKGKKDRKEKKEKKDKKDKKQKGDINTVGTENGDIVVPHITPSSTIPPAADGVKVQAIAGTYKQTASLDAVPEAEIQSFLSQHQISVSDPSSSSSSPAASRPVIRFDLLPSSTLLSHKPFASFSTPTPIQAASWPFALSGRDVVGVAETGSGKTYAFAIPCVEALMASSSSSSKKKSKSATTQPRAAIVSPTRELAMQTHAAISTLASLVGLSAVCIYGGSNKDDQRTQLRRGGGADIVVATPGRLKDFMGDDTVSLARAGFVVLDEADRMLDKGFEDDIRFILGACPSREQRQTLMFTATWPTSVRGLAEGFMVNPVKITIGGRGVGGGGGEDGEGGEGNGSGQLQANSRITQKVEVVDPRGKEQRLFQLLQEAQKGKGKNDRILVFCLYKKEAVRVEQTLQRKGIRVASIHGDLRQEQRTRSLEAFKAGTTTVLVATDVAARGLDIPEVKLVINVTVRQPVFHPSRSPYA